MINNPHDLQTVDYSYPLVNIQKNIEHHHAIDGKIHYKLPEGIKNLLFVNNGEYSSSICK